MIASALLAALLVAGLVLFEGLAVPAWGPVHSRATLSTELAEWWDVGSQSRERMTLDVERSASGPLEDGVAWKLTLHRGDGPEAGFVAEPDAAMLARALESMEGRRGGNVSIHAAGYGSLATEHEVVKDMLGEGKTRHVEVYGLRRSLNVAWAISPFLAAALALHLGYATVLGLLRWTTGRTPRALRGWMIAIAASCLLLPGAALALWMNRDALPQPWWPLVVSPIAAHLAVLATSLLVMGAKLRRARRAGYQACTRCLYDLRSLPEADACPECGLRYERAATMAMWQG